MSERFGLMGLATVESQYLEGRAVLNCSDVTAAAVDEEVRKIMEDCYKEAKRILSENMDAMDMIAEQLIREETITGKDFMRLFRKAKGEMTEEDRQIEAQPEADSEVKAVAAAETEPKAAAETEPKAAAETEPKAAAETGPKAEAEAEAAGKEQEEQEEEEPSADDGVRGRFSDVSQKDVDRFFDR
jgi:cell division protease FtsH